jgi:outer membrane protein assembly factor BamB
MVQFMAMMWGPMAGAVLILVWWMFASRFPWRVRWAGLAGMIVGMAAAFTLGHPSMRMGFVIVGLPVSLTASVLAAVVGSFLGNRAAGVLVPIAALGVWAFFACLRLDGIDGSIHSSVSFRWVPTAEDRYLAARANQVTSQSTSLPATLPAAVVLTDGDWPGFRGAGRDGKLSGVRISTNWDQQPPRLLWRRLIGPGWSSCCVIGDRLFTQEQRGVDEVVVCLNFGTGQELWAHKDRARFAEAMGGAGPRATPTFADGKLYALGASGILNCLDPLTGNVIWTRNVATDTAAPTPQWGFSASPLVFAGLVTVITGGPGKSLTAYDANTGAPAWAVGDGWSYASPQVSRLAGVDSLLLVTARGVSGFDPLKGQLLWQHDFPIGAANRCVQPALVSDHEFLLGAAFGIGTRRVSITSDGGGWKTQAVWTTRKLKPYYNDMVVHKGRVYGFDGSAFVCFDPESGESNWRAGGYGNGQVLLLADQDLLLVLSEQGNAALVEARPDTYHEIGRFQAIDGKTWNHPVIAHNNLVVRNGQEIACYQVN